MWLHKAAPVDLGVLASFSSMYPNFNPNARQIGPSGASGMVPGLVPCIESEQTFIREKAMQRMSQRIPPGHE
jgi:hypothetical protein